MLFKVKEGVVSNSDVMIRLGLAFKLLDSPTCEIGITSGLPIAVSRAHALKLLVQ